MANSNNPFVLHGTPNTFIETEMERRRNLDVIGQNTATQDTHPGERQIMGRDIESYIIDRLTGELDDSSPIVGYRGAESLDVRDGVIIDPNIPESLTRSEADILSHIREAVEESARNFLFSSNSEGVSGYHGHPGATITPPDPSVGVRGFDNYTVSPGGSFQPLYSTSPSLSGISIPPAETWAPQAGFRRGRGELPHPEPSWMGPDELDKYIRDLGNTVVAQNAGPKVTVKEYEIKRKSAQWAVHKDPELMKFANEDPSVFCYDKDNNYIIPSKIERDGDMIRIYFEKPMKGKLIVKYFTW
jgi:hypothetical protein